MNRILHVVINAGVMACLLIVGATSTWAQETSDPDTVVVKSNRVVLKTEDGESVVVFMSDDDEPFFKHRVMSPGRSVWFNSDDDTEHVFRRFEADHPNAFFFRGPDGEGDFTVDIERFGEDNVWFGEEFDALRNRLHGDVIEFEGGRFELEGAMKERVEISRLDAESHRMARAVRQAEGAEREQLQQELEDKLEAIYERKLELRRERLEQLQQELNEQRDQIETREQARQEILERRLRELLGEPDELKW